MTTPSPIDPNRLLLTGENPYIRLSQTDDGPTYEITVRNSFAHYLATWLLDAMAEYRPA